MFPDVTLQLAPLWPAWLGLAVMAALLVTLAWGTLLLVRKRISLTWIAVLTSLRLGILALFLLILLQPVLVHTGMVEQRPELLVVADNSPSMAGPSATGKGSKVQEVLTAVREGALGKSLEEHYRVRWYEQPTSSLAAALADPAYQQQALGVRPTRVLLLSDGSDQGSGDPVDSARRLGLTVDVLTPGPGPAASPAVEIIDVQAARRVLLGSETHFRVTLGRQQAGTELNAFLRLSEDGKHLWDRPVTLQAGRGEETFLLAHKPDATGSRQYEVRLLTGPKEAPQETGKPFSLGLDVLDSKYEVLILEDHWRWEYKFLHRLFEDDPSFRFTALLSRGSKAYVEFASPDRRVNLVGFPQGRSELEGFDTFILGDIVPARWPAGLAGSLARLVSDEGKSLVVIAGPGLASLLDFPELEMLLPVELTPSSGKPVEGPIDVRLRPDADGSPFFFQLRAGLESLPPIDRIYPVLRKRAGATVLVEATKQRGADGNLIVLAEHTVGRGRVLFVAADTLWKWHTLAEGEGPSPYSIFWQQAFRALTPSRLAAGPVNLWLMPERSRSAVGRPLTVHAEVQADRPLVAAQLQGVWTMPDERRVPVAFVPDPGTPSRFHTEFTPLVVGPHRLTASLLSEGKAAASAAANVQVHETPLTDHAVDEMRLTRLAQATGGRRIDPQRPDTWPQPPSAASAQITQTKRVDLWSNFTLLMALCTLLGADWFIRVFKGLV